MPRIYWAPSATAVYVAGGLACGGTRFRPDRRTPGLCRVAFEEPKRREALPFHRWTMEALVTQQRRRPLFETRFDYWALAPAAAALCYPFLLKAFHALVGAPPVTPSPFAILGAVVVLAVAFVVPFLGLAMALRPSAGPGTRRLA